MKLPVRPSTPSSLPSAPRGDDPTPRFRRYSWARIQRALDPLGRPRPLRDEADR